MKRKAPHFSWLRASALVCWNVFNVILSWLFKASADDIKLISNSISINQSNCCICGHYWLPISAAIFSYLILWLFSSIIHQETLYLTDYIILFHVLGIFCELKFLLTIGKSVSCKQCLLLKCYSPLLTKMSIHQVQYLYNWYLVSATNKTIQLTDSQRLSFSFTFLLFHTN